jgi:group I intron endonuclease
VSYAYSIHNPATGDEYIGITGKPPRKRWLQHVAAARRGQGRKLGAALRAQGVDAFVFSVIVVAPDAETTKAAEIALIAQLKPSLNLTLGGDGGCGYEWPEEARAKMRKRMIGSQINLGKVCSAEKRAAIAAKLRGRKLSLERVAKLKGRRAPNKGVPMSAETKAKVSAAKKGQKLTADQEARRVAALRAVASTPEFLANCSRASKEVWVQRRADPEYKEKARAAALKAWVTRRSRGC